MYTKEEIKNEYARWAELATKDPDLKRELSCMDAEGIKDAFYCDLTFGTGGLRGMIGAGTNRMNVYTVAKATKGLAAYLQQSFESPSVVIGYDSRVKSDVFANIAAGVFAAEGIAVHIWDRLMPVPSVSFAVRALSASAGVMITASHNPCQYNGYKVYGADGCQITTAAAEEIFGYIQKTDVFSDVCFGDYEKLLGDGMISYISEAVYTDYIENVKAQSVLYGDGSDKEISIVYSPLNGTGRQPVLRVLRESGYPHISVVKEQEMPDGLFSTCPYPNPEMKEALSLGITYAERIGADLMLATDPDCDRVGVAVPKGEDYILLSGNEVGMLLLDYICAQRTKHNCMPPDPVMVKTVVSIDMASQIAAKYGVRTVDVLTGFKFIGEQIGFLEEQGKKESFIFGFEESYGYLSGSYVRDKDGVNGAFLICEMVAFYKARGISVLDKLQELYHEFGYCFNTLHFFTFEGSDGFQKMQAIMRQFRSGLQMIGNKKVCAVRDYSIGLDGLPKSDVLKFLLQDGCSVTVRPSGTEPKLKMYISVSSSDKETAVAQEAEMIGDLKQYLA